MLEDGNGSMIDGVDRRLGVSRRVNSRCAICGALRVVSTIGYNRLGYGGPMAGECVRVAPIPPAEKADDRSLFRTYPLRSACEYVSPVEPVTQATDLSRSAERPN